jgi:hypothetical protein
MSLANRTAGPPICIGSGHDVNDWLQPGLGKTPADR